MIKEDENFIRDESGTYNSGEKVCLHRGRGLVWDSPSGKMSPGPWEEYLLREEMIRKKILAGLSGAESVSAKTRLAEVKEEMELIHTALKRYEHMN